MVDITSLNGFQIAVSVVVFFVLLYIEFKIIQNYGFGSLYGFIVALSAISAIIQQGFFVGLISGVISGLLVGLLDAGICDLAYEKSGDSFLKFLLWIFLYVLLAIVVFGLLILIGVLIFNLIKK